MEKTINRKIQINKTIVFISNDENKLQKICGVIYKEKIK